MYVCVCNAITDHQIRAAAAQGVCTLEELARQTGCGDCCGSCSDLAGEILAEAGHRRTRAFPLELAVAA
ncbi:MAG: (2Fe-2S)-binding protein [Dokdonella sp.]